MPDYDSTSADGILIAAAQAGEAEAFAHLVRRYQGPLLKVAASRLRSAQLAEEAVQETFLCAHKWLHTYDSRYSFRTWLWTILLNQCSRQAKREARQADLVGAKAEGQSARADDCGEPSPLSQLLAREDNRLVQELLARLPDAQADALRLRFFGSLSFPEIAATMQCSESGAKNRVKTGLLTLSRWLTQPCIAATIGREPMAGATTSRAADGSATTGRGYARGE
jgi:RNA polymerase sigma-70 factor (ECF subfamily)